MALLLLAITKANLAPLALEGPSGRAVVRMDAAGLSAWVCPTDDDATFGRADLLAHHQAVSRIHDHADGALPARFPTQMDEVAVRSVLEARQAEYAVALERIAGRVELAVTAVWTDDASIDRPSSAPDPATRPGTSYLRTRREAFAVSDDRRARATRLAEQLEAIAGADLVASKRQLCPSPTVALSEALLVPRGVAEVLTARLAPQTLGLRILVNGPWPPYTFAASNA